MMGPGGHSATIFNLYLAIFATMIVKSAEFICSNTQISKLPPPVKAEYAFIGRSNVGKSSLINMLTGKKGLAKTSQTPGKTQLINHFLVNDNWYIVDLPGYGYARASKTKKADWNKFIQQYLDKRESLQCVMVLIDSRLEPQKIDIEFCNWLGEKGLSFVLVFTKADKQSSIKTDQKRHGNFRTRLFRLDVHSRHDRARLARQGERRDDCRRPDAVFVEPDRPGRARY